MDPADRNADLAALDLEIVSAGMRLAYDDEAMRDLFRAWDARFRAAGRLPNERDDDRLFAHLRALGPLFDTMDEAIFTDEIERTISAVAAPAFVFTPDGVVVELNRPAVERYGLRQGARSDFAFVQPVSLDDLNGVRASARTGGNRRHAILQLWTDGGDAGFAEVFPVRPRHSEATLIAMRSLEIDWTDEISDQLAEAFALTPAEIDVCRLFYAVQNVDTVSEMRARSRRTVGVQLSSIFQKTGTENQLGLFRLLAFMCARNAIGRSSDFQPWSDPYDREEIFVAPDGQKIAHTWIGAPRGRPVLFLHGLSVGYAMDPRAEAVLADAGIRLVAMTRPGHGHSDLGPARGAVEGAAAAARLLIDGLGLGPCPAIGLGSASAPLLEIAARSPGLLTGVLSVGGYLPMSRREYLRTQPALHRAGFTIYQTTPWLITVLGRRFLGTIKRHGYSQYLDMAYAESPTDLAVIARHDVRPLIMSACSLMTAQGMDAFVRDLGLYLHDWIALLPDLRVPYHILHGAHDPTARRDQLEAVVASHPLLSLDVFPDAAELVFYQRPRDVAEAVIAFEARCR